jgi:RND family efflux transporter MFP subunit
MTPTRVLPGLAALFLATAAPAAEFAVAPITIDETKAVFGTVESRDAVLARARIAGTVRDVRIDEGSDVAEGEVVATIVDDKLAIQQRAADARIQALSSELANAQTDLARAEELLKTGSGTQARVDAARTAVEVLVNQLAAAEADRAVIAAQSAEGDVLAPAGGRILRVPVTEGSVVMAGEEIALVAGGGYFLRLALPERHAAEITEGSTVHVGDRPGGAGHAGRLAKVYPQITEGRVLADVEVDGLGDYFVGERTLVWIPVGVRTVLSVPPEAIATRHGVDYVRLAGEPPMDVAVIPGSRFEANGEVRVEILSGLRAGDRVMLP